MRVKVRASPVSSKKYRVTFEDDNTFIDFGAAGASDYTRHKDPLRMRSYLIRHGARGVSQRAREETNALTVHKQMLNITSSHREKWGRTGIKTAGFWSRWYLWSVPTLKGARAHMTRKFGIVFV